MWNSSYEHAKKEGKSDKEAEEIAFRNASGVIKKENDEGKTVKTHSDITESGDTDKKTLDTVDNFSHTKLSTGTHRMETPQVTLEDLISPEKLKETQRQAILAALRDELKLSEGKQDAPPDPNAQDNVLAAEQDYATVSGEKVKREDFAYAPAGSKPSEWKLPVHDKNHTQNALARFNQTDLPADAKAGVKRKILERAHKFGIDTSGFEKEHENASEQLTDEQSQRMFWLLSDLTPMSLNGKQVVEIPICIAGTWVKGDHKFSITSDDIDSMIRNFEQRANGQTVIDYEHASEMPELAKGGAIPAAGWMHGLRKRKIHDPRSKELVDALTALAEWTPKAEEMLKNGEYRFFSPAIDWSKTDKKTGKPIGAALTSGALTNHPFLEELPPITLSDHIVLSEKEELTNTDQVHVPNANDKVSVDYATDKDTKKMAKKKLKLEKIQSGDKAGKYGVFDADNNVLMHVFSSKLSDAIETMDDFEKSEILADFDPDHDGDNDASKKGDTDKDFAGKKEKASDVEAAADKTDKTLEVTAVETPKKTEAQLLSECINVPTSDAGVKESAKADFDLDKVAEMATSGDLKPTAFLTVNKVKAEVEKLIADGKVLPKQRESMYKIALSDPQGFAEFAAKAEPVIDTTVKGIQGGERELQKKLNDGSDATAVFMSKVDELKAKNGGNFELALKEAAVRYNKEYTAHIEQTLRLSEQEHPALRPTKMIASR